MSYLQKAKNRQCRLSIIEDQALQAFFVKCYLQIYPFFRPDYPVNTDNDLLERNFFPGILYGA